MGPNEDISWVMNNFNDDMAKYAGDLMNSMSEVLLGRVTYEIMSKAWPNQTEATSPGADKMNYTPKIVFSRTLDKADWVTYENARVVKDHVAE